MHQSWHLMLIVTKMTLCCSNVNQVKVQLCCSLLASLGKKSVISFEHNIIQVDRKKIKCLHLLYSVYKQITIIHPSPWSNHESSQREGFPGFSRKVYVHAHPIKSERSVQGQEEFIFQHYQLMTYQNNFPWALQVCTWVGQTGRGMEQSYFLMSLIPHSQKLQAFGYNTVGQVSIEYISFSTYI